MFISEFYSKLMSGQDGNRLFDVLRQVSRLEKPALLSAGGEAWAEWPPIGGDGPQSIGFQLTKA